MSAAPPDNGRKEVLLADANDLIDLLIVSGSVCVCRHGWILCTHDLHFLSPGCPLPGMRRIAFFLYTYYNLN